MTKPATQHPTKSGSIELMDEWKSPKSPRDPFGYIYHENMIVVRYEEGNHGAWHVCGDKRDAALKIAELLQSAQLGDGAPLLITFDGKTVD